MAKVLLDCGAHDGRSIGKLEGRYGPFDRIYAWEPDSRVFGRLEEAYGRDARCTLVNGAVWTSDCWRDLHCGEQTESSSLRGDKTKGDLYRNPPQRVPCVDLSRFLEEEMGRDDHVVMKMDVEGAEYDILEHLCTTGQLGRVNVLLVEWHANRLTGVSKDQHNALRSKVIAWVGRLEGWR